MLTAVSRDVYDLHMLSVEHMGAYCQVTYLCYGAVSLFPSFFFESALWRQIPTCSVDDNLWLFMLKDLFSNLLPSSFIGVYVNRRAEKCGGRQSWNGDIVLW